MDNDNKPQPDADQPWRPHPDFPHHNADGIDLSLIRSNLARSPQMRLRVMDRARRSALRIMAYGRQHRQESA
jgi:hypothetical protein